MKSLIVVLLIIAAIDSICTDDVPTKDPAGLLCKFIESIGQFLWNIQFVQTVVANCQYLQIGVEPFYRESTTRSRLTNV